jgi:transcriptional regulator with XRE-family HTH domain
MSEDVKPYGAGSGPPADEPTPEELRALIARIGLSQRRTAEALGMGERQMRYFASGQATIPIVVIYALRYLASQVGDARPSDRPLRKLLAELRAKVEEARKEGTGTVAFDATRGELNMLINDGPFQGVMIEGDGIYLGDRDVIVNIVDAPAASGEAPG